jgi:hypothetical protein
MFSCYGILRLFLVHRLSSSKRWTSTICTKEKERWSSQRLWKQFEADVNIKWIDFKCNAYATPWFDFNPHMDVHIDDFVGVQLPRTT